ELTARAPEAYSARGSVKVYARPVEAHRRLADPELARHRRRPSEPGRRRRRLARGIPEALAFRNCPDERGVDELDQGKERRCEQDEGNDDDADERIGPVESDLVDEPDNEREADERGGGLGRRVHLDVPTTSSSLRHASCTIPRCRSSWRRSPSLARS